MDMSSKLKIQATLGGRSELAPTLHSADPKEHDGSCAAAQHRHFLLLRLWPGVHSGALSSGITNLSCLSHAYPDSLPESMGCLMEMLQLRQGGCAADPEQRDGGCAAARDRHLPAASPAALRAPPGALATSALRQGRVHQEPARGAATLLPDFAEGRPSSTCGSISGISYLSCGCMS